MAVHNFAVTVAAAGTPVQLKTTYQKAAWVLIQPVLTGGTKVYFGGPGLTPTSGGILSGGDSFLFPPVGNTNQYDLSNIWVDVGTNGDGVQGVYGTN